MEDRMKDRDIYKWSYNEKTLKEKSDGHNNGTTYWAVSKIGIWDEEAKKLVDTYWSSQNRCFSEKDISDRLVLIFVANLNDLVQVDHKSQFNNYDDIDCIDISHPNSSRSGFYIKKNAKPSVNKKRKVLEAHIKYEKGRIDWHKRSLELLEKDLLGLSVDTHVPYDSKVYIY